MVYFRRGSISPLTTAIGNTSFPFSGTNHQNGQEQSQTRARRLHDALRDGLRAMHPPTRRREILLPPPLLPPGITDHPRRHRLSRGAKYRRSRTLEILVILEITILDIMSNKWDEREGIP